MIKFSSEKRPVYILTSSSVAGKKENDGPIGHLIDLCGDDRFGKNTWEKSEAEMQRIALSLSLNKLKWKPDDIDCLFAGDLINQCVSSSYGLMSFGIPFLGLYGACSTCAEGMIMAYEFSSGSYRHCASVTSSHYCSAERQFRFPLEYGGQRSPTAQWTVTGAASFLYSSLPDDLSYVHDDYVPEIIDFFPGRIMDSGMKDVNNMGAAMAPAAYDTLKRYFSHAKETDTIDKIITGDLGIEGTKILDDLLKSSGFDCAHLHSDCGKIIYDVKNSDTHSGGSGCGCGAVVMSSYFLNKIRTGELSDVLFLATGALMNSMTVQQKETIPTIAHLVRIKARKVN